MLKELKTQHRTIIQMVFSGFSNNEIAERLEMSPSAVSSIIRSPLGQAYLGGLNDKAQEDTLDVRKKLTSLNKSALSTFERILDPRQKAPHSVQATVARDILDRNGYKPPDKLNIDMSVTTKTDQEIDAEIAAIQQSINKTQFQDPIKQVADSSTGQEPEQKLESEYAHDLKPTKDHSLPEHIDSDDQYWYDEIQSDLLDTISEKIPTDLFDSRNKAS